MSYPEFRVIVENKSSIRIIRPDGTTPKGTIDQDEMKKLSIKFFHKMLADGNITSRDELILLGSYLYELLFDIDASSIFKEDFDNVKRDEYLRLVLEFEKDADELAEFPWEYIYYSSRRGWGQQGFFLANESKLILTRHVPLDKRLKNLEPDNKPLRILIVVSKPENDENGQELGSILESKVLDSITGLQKNFPQAIETHILEKPTLAKFGEKLIAVKPHVLHFIGHGYHDGEKGWLAFVKEDDFNMADWRSDGVLASLLTEPSLLTGQDDRDYQPPRLVFLHACEGARSTSYKTFGGMALKLVKSRIPAVVAMQYKVENAVANLFAETFYQLLGEGKPIDEAVQAGRRKLSTYLAEGEKFSSRAFGSPVVFLQSADGIIIAESQPKPGVFKCPSCDKPILPNRRFCRSCGQEVKECVRCHHMMPFDGICPDCRYPLPEKSASSTGDQPNIPSQTNMSALRNITATASGTSPAKNIEDTEDTIKIG